MRRASYEIWPQIIKPLVSLLACQTLHELSSCNAPSLVGLVGVKCDAVNRSTAVGGAATLLAIVAVVVTDLAIPAAGAWWDRHSLIGSFVTSVLILGVTVQVVDQVAARRKIKDRKRVAAVQALIVYGQAVRAGRVLVAAPGQPRSGDPESEVQTLASMVLIAAPALFEDPAARAFMEKVERFSTLLVRMLRHRDGELTETDRARLSEAKDALSASLQPLLSRLQPQDVATLEDAAPV
jgi:hypothetical protein